MILRTVRDLIYWEWSKIIAEKVSGSRRDYAIITYSFKRLKAGEISMSTVLRENKLFVQADKSCVYCGSSERLQWEHIIARSRGGPDTIDNLVLACQPCNLSKGVRDPFDWYGKARRNEIPRLVVGKYLKLVYEKHEALGTLDTCGDADGGSVRLSDLMTAFDRG